MPWKNTVLSHRGEIMSPYPAAARYYLLHTIFMVFLGFWKPISDDEKDDLDTSTSCFTRFINVLPMTSQSITQCIMNMYCDTDTWKVINNSLDIDFIHDHMRDRSCKNYIYYICNNFNSYTNNTHINIVWHKNSGQLFKTFFTIKCNTISLTLTRTLTLFTCDRSYEQVFTSPRSSPFGKHINHLIFSVIYSLNQKLVS